MPAACLGTSEEQLASALVLVCVSAGVEVMI